MLFLFVFCGLQLITKNYRQMKQSNQELIEAKAFFDNMGIEYLDIVLPINSDIYCVKRTDRQWAAFKIGVQQPIVEFGKYNHMWGFDKGCCLVSVINSDTTTFANRGIIDSYGREIIKPYTYLDIWGFYGKDISCIRAVTYEGVPIEIPVAILKLL